LKAILRSLANKSAIVSKFPENHHLPIGAVMRKVALYIISISMFIDKAMPLTTPAASINILGGQLHAYGGSRARKRDIRKTKTK
jgi:hypothetical protein